MSEKKIKTIEAFDYVSWKDETHMPPSHYLSDFKAWVDMKAAEHIPVEFMHTAKIYFRNVAMDGDTEIAVNLTYDRPETDEEQTKRQKGEKARVAFDEHSQRQTYEKLKRKFEPQTK